MNRNEKALNAIIARFNKEWQAVAEKAIKELYKLVEGGKKVDVAVKVLERKYPELFQLPGLIDSLVEAAAYGYGIVPEVLTAAAYAKMATAMERPWASDGMTLSRRLHGASKQMREAIVDTVRTQLNLNASWTNAARELYDGYNSGKAVVREQDIPNYLRLVRHATAGSPEQLRAARQAMNNINRLARNGAPTKSLKAAYNQLVEQALTGSDEALQKACWVAVQEKSRYVAERIARTEMARAYADGFLADIEADDDVVALKWKTNTRHPVFDICDMFAKADMYGLGQGIYPKDKLPKLPAHPHCMCKLVKIYADDLGGKKAKENIEDAGNAYLEKLSDNQRMQLMGIDGAKTWKSGESWQDYLRSWQGIGKQESRLKYAQLYKIPEFGMDVIGDEYHSSKNIIRKFDTRQVRNSRYNMMVSEHVNLKPRMLADIETQIDQAVKVLRINKSERLPQIIIVSHQDIVGALGAYVAVCDKLYLSTDIFNQKANMDIIQKGKGELPQYGITTVVHEFIHWMDAKKYEKRYGKITNQQAYVLAIREMHKPNVDKLKAKGYNINGISSYAAESDVLGKYEEVMTEYRSLLHLKEVGVKCITRKLKKKKNYGRR